MEFEVLIPVVAIIASACVILMLLHQRHERRMAAESKAISGAEQDDTLRRSVARLEARMKVIERITVEKENSLEREIEQLR